jgi:hypothetical protein
VSVASGDPDQQGDGMGWERMGQNGGWEGLE